jgi:antitoxin component YwqK of YwqJK toxin-antitoxin module
MYAYKSAKNNDKSVVITLFIGEKSKSNVNRKYLFKSLYAKHRCNKAYVIRIEDDYKNQYDFAETICSKTNKITKYIKNQYIIADEYDENKENVNGAGIVFFLDKDLARNYKRILGDQIWLNVNNIYKTFYNNGSIKERIYFIYSPYILNDKGIKDDKILYHSIEEWYENEIPKFTQKFIYNNYQITEWYENGSLMKQYHSMDDKIDGIYTEWYVNGNLKTIKQYNNGILNGLCTEWHINGNKRLETEYENGKIIEKYKKIYKNNQEIIPNRSIKLSSIKSTRLNFDYKKIIPFINLPIKDSLIKKEIKRSSSVNLYDKYKDTDTIINEIKNKKELIKTNSVHYNIRKNISDRLQLKLYDNKYLEIN